MASVHYNDAVVTINSVNLSPYVKSATLNQTANELEDTAMGDTFKSRIGGLKDWSIEIEFNADFGAAAVDATLAAIGVGSTTSIAIKPTSGAISTTNPEWSGTALLKDYGAVSGSVGDLLTSKASFSGSGALTRDVTP